MIETYCVSCKKNTAIENSSAKKKMLLSNCAVLGKKRKIKVQ